MKKVILLILLIVSVNFVSALAEDKTESPKVDVSSSEYSLEITISDIPKDQQTLFIPIKIDTMVLDFDKVVLDDVAAQNILAVASSSMDKVGPGIGLIKFDEAGLPSSLKLKVLLKSVGDGQTSVSLLKVADEPALLSKGTVINDLILVKILGSDELNISEKIEKDKKKLVLSENKLTLDIKRPAQQEETIFVPLIFDRNIFDLDETFGHAIIAPGISAKTFSSGSLHEGGPGVEIVLSAEADKDFTVDVDLIPRKAGKAKIVAAFPQKGHTALVRGPVVNISPGILTVAKVTAVKGE